MKLRRTTEGVIVEDPARERWISLPRAAAAAGKGAEEPMQHDVVSLLAGGAAARSEVEAMLDAVADDASVTADPSTAGLPFEARSLRAFSLWEAHYEGSARMLVKRFFPSPLQRAAGSFERVTRRTFPPFKPNRRFYEVPAFYVGNHAAMLADGEEMPWPSHTRYLDFELELALVLARPLADPTPAEAREAVGGWFVLNDWSAREIQAEEARHGMRPGAGPLDRAGTDGRAGDRRDRHSRQQDRRPPVRRRRRPRLDRLGGRGRLSRYAATWRSADWAAL